MLTITNLSCHYGVIQALKNVCIDIQEPGIYTVIGANGAGKSTLINAINGQVPVSTGSILFNGVDITCMDSHQIATLGISVCPEGRRIFSAVTVHENLLAGAYVLKNKKRIAENVDKVFQLFPRLSERRKQIAGTLSGGEQQMLAVGRALMADPKFILMDEPSMGLAPNLVDFVFETIVRIYQELAVPSLIVEQNSEMALSISNYAYLLEVGTLVLEGTGCSLLNNDTVRQKYLGA